MNKLVVEYNNSLAFHPAYNLSEIMQNEELSINEYAKKINVSKDKLQSFLNGELLLDDELLNAIINTYGMSKSIWLKGQERYLNFLKKIKKEHSIEKTTVYNDINNKISNIPNKHFYKNTNYSMKGVIANESKRIFY